MAVAMAGRRVLPSIGFSGAGFLTCYHLGVAECLLRNGVLPTEDKLPESDSSHKPMVLTGVSGGALVATAVSLGIRPEDGLQATISVAEEARRIGGIMDHLRPGFSLIDRMELAMTSLLADVDEEFALRRIQNGNLLRIGVTEIREFKLANIAKSYRYIDHFASVEEIIAACVLSSYVPGMTGPLTTPTLRKNSAATRANKILVEMARKGSLKDFNGNPLLECHYEAPENGSETRIRFLDGGLANLFPVIDRHRRIVTPFHGQFPNPVISPRDAPHHSMGIQDAPAQPLMCMDNLITIRYIAFSSNSTALEAWYEQGYNDAKRFLSK